MDTLKIKCPCCGKDEFIKLETSFLSIGSINDKEINFENGVSPYFCKNCGHIEFLVSQERIKDVLEGNKIKEKRDAEQKEIKDNTEKKYLNRIRELELSQKKLALLQAELKKCKDDLEREKIKKQIKEKEIGLKSLEKRINQYKEFHK